jgi:hypothetical protein
MLFIFEKEDNVFVSVADKMPNPLLFDGKDSYFNNSKDNLFTNTTSTSTPMPLLSAIPETPDFRRTLRSTLR